MKESESKKWKAEVGAEPCWIVWEAATDGGRPYLVAVDTSEDQANRHVFLRKDAARVQGKPPPQLRVEESWLDHLYGESMTQSFDEAKKMVREVQRAQIAELRTRLARAIAIARGEISRSPRPLTVGQKRKLHDELDDLEKILP